jgi:hypothetical protein
MRDVVNGALRSNLVSYRSPTRERPLRCGSTWGRRGGLVETCRSRSGNSRGTLRHAYLCPRGKAVIPRRFCRIQIKANNQKSLVRA